MKKSVAIVALALLAAALVSSSVGAASTPAPAVTIELVSGLPSTMEVGQLYDVTIRVTSSEPFRLAMALPDDQFPGKGVVARGGDHSGAGTAATLTVTFRAVGSTSGFPDGRDYVAVVAGARFAGGQTVGQRFDFAVTVP